MKKKLLGIILILCMVLSLLPALSFDAFAAETTRSVVLLENTDKELVLEADTGGVPVYTKNESGTFVDSADHEFVGWYQVITTVTDEANDEWNTKYFYDKEESKWKLVLKGAKIDVYNHSASEEKKTVKDSAVFAGGDNKYSGTKFKYSLNVVTVEDSYIGGHYLLLVNVTSSGKMSNVTFASENDATLYGDSASYGLHSQANIYIKGNLNVNTHGNTFFNSTNKKSFYLNSLYT